MSERQVFILKTFKVFVPVFLILTVIFSTLSPVISTAENISNKVLRLHILANSDSAYDQNIKLELRNYFLENTSTLFSADTLDGNIKAANENKDNIEDMCNEYLKQYNQCAQVSVVKEYFATRVYDDFTLPAGYYNSIKIEIGEGKGHNWWCIVFPSVCLSSCSTSMDDYLTEDEMELLESGYTPKFKIIEIYERIKGRLEK